MTDEQVILDIPAPPAPDLQEPQVRFTFSDSVILFSEPAGPRAEVLRLLRTQLTERHIRLGRRAIAVCGAGTGVGVSFMATNLAVAFARAGANTLLIDANMREPAIQTFIVPDRRLPGLAQCLAGEGCGGLAAVQANVLPNLSILYSGGPEAEALEKLSGPRFQALMAMCMRDFDFVIIDTPPAGRYADVLHIAAAARHGLVVLRKHVSFLDDADTLINQLRASRAGIAGIVLNEY